MPAPAKPFQDFWDPDNNLGALFNNYQHTIEFIKKDLAYYQNNREKSRTWSKIIKLITILLITTATCLPLLNSFSGEAESDKLARANTSFVLMGIAGALFIIDKYFGFTTKWIRLKTTEINLSVALSDFTQDWIVFLATVNGQFTKELYVEGQQKIAALRKKIDLIKTTEVQDWLKEYQQSMADLSTKIDSMSKTAMADAQKMAADKMPGGLILKITNVQKFDSIAVRLDDSLVKEYAKINETLFENLIPKHYSLRVTGKINSKEFFFDKVIVVAAKTVGTESITLPES